MKTHASTAKIAAFGDLWRSLEIFGVEELFGIHGVLGDAGSLGMDLLTQIPPSLVDANVVMQQTEQMESSCQMGGQIQEIAWPSPQAVFFWFYIIQYKL